MGRKTPVDVMEGRSGGGGGLNGRYKEGEQVNTLDVNIP